jgi:hypothetical protein
MMSTGQMATTALHVEAATLLLNRPTKQSLPSLIVTPSTSIVFWTPGGPFSPSLVEYRVGASTGTVSYSIRIPSWLTASSSLARQIKAASQSRLL